MSSTSTREARRHLAEVERLLAGRGLLRSPRRVRSTDRLISSPVATIAALKSVLEELGGVFAAFGRYLSLRADLLAATDCLALEGLADAASRTPAAAVDQRLRDQLGRNKQEAFSAFEATPFETRWLDQAHRARLRGGEPVVVRLIHPYVEDDLEPGLEALGVLKGTLSGPGFSTGDHFTEVLADFRRSVAARLDMSLQADALEELGRDARRSDLLVVPQVYRDLSTRKVLTVQWLPGFSVEEIAARPALQEIDAEDLARRIGLIWLQMALIGHRFPTDAEVVELPDGRLAVTGGVFAALPEDSRVNMWNYLRATAEHFPDHAAASLLREVSKLRPDAVEAELRTRVRQVVPFRDGSWSTSGESLGEYAVLHWRLLRRTGFRPPRYLDNFYQGLFWAARNARRAAPQSDSLAEALRDFDWLAGWNQLRQLTMPAQLATSAESFLVSLLELPTKIDRILGFATGEKGFRLASATTPKRRRRRNATVVVLSLGLAMAALVLLSDQWLVLGAAAGLSAAWSERLLAALFLVFGLVLLKTAGKNR